VGSEEDLRVECEVFLNFLNLCVLVGKENSGTLFR
jgi:hypothetical protein